MFCERLTREQKAERSARIGRLALRACIVRRRAVLLKAWRLGRPFTVADLAEPCKPMMVVEAIGAMMTDEFIEQVSLGGCRWCYRLTPDGIAEAERIARLEAVAA